MNSGNFILKGARIIDPLRKIDQKGDIGVRGGRIVDPGKVDNPRVVELDG